MTRERVNTKAAGKEPYRLWNAYVDVLALSDRQDLTDVQVPPHLAFWYDSEVQNGGHLQYFLNRGLDEAREAVDALHVLGAEPQREVLAGAIRFYQESGIDERPPVSVEDYCSLALEDHFGQLDSAYHACAPDMPELLQRYLDAHVSDFIEFTDERVRDRLEFPWHVTLRLRVRRMLGLMP